MFLRLDCVLLASLTESGVGFTSFSERRFERRARESGRGEAGREGKRARDILIFSYSVELKSGPKVW